MKPTLSVSIDQSSSLDALANDQQNPNSAQARESMPTSISEHISSQYGAALEKHLKENALTKHETENTQNGQRKYKHKKAINLPRRASKRLAGIKVDPVPELKTSNRVRRVAVNQLCEGKMSTNMDERPCCLTNGVVKQFDAVEGGSESKSKFDSTTNTMEKQGTVEEHIRVIENGDKVYGKLDYSLDIPLGELLTDPCIAFAIQTLTGVTFETYYKNSQFMSKHYETLEAAEGQNIGDEQEGCKNVLSPPENLSIPKDCAAAADDDEIDHTDKGNENSGPSSEMSLDSWMDPCIEFAIKTLTDSGSTTPLDTFKF